jgi:hypothetical protein
MSGDEIRKEVLRFLRGNSPSSTRDVRRAVTARAGRVDEALRALLTERRVDWTDSGWCAVRRDGTRYGHATSRRPSPSGAQLSYFKAIDVLAEYFAETDGLDPMDASWTAREILRPALPAKQRARLDASIGR